MGYTIVYDKKFVKTQRGIIPVILSGSSNCYSHNSRGNEVRTRSWCVFRFAESPMPGERIMDEVMQLVPSRYGEHFKYNGKWVNDEGFVNFFKSGIKNAMTLEDLINKYVVHDMSVELYAKDLEAKSEWACAKSVFSRRCRTNNELEDALTEALAAHSQLPRESYPYFGYSFGYENERLETRRKKRHAQNTAESGYLIRLGNGGYFKKRSSRRMWSTDYADYARHFRTQYDAEQYCAAELKGYKTAADAIIVARKLVIALRGESGRPSERMFWVGSGFTANKAFAKTFNTKKQAEKEKDTVLAKMTPAGADVYIETELFEVGAASKAVASEKV